VCHGVVGGRGVVVGVVVGVDRVVGAVEIVVNGDDVLQCVT